jgi:hypothetical protein
MLRAFADRPAEVTIQVRSHAGGDVEFLVFATGPRRQFDFPEIARWDRGSFFVVCQPAVLL